MNLDFRNTNALWCSVAAETLWRAGVRHAVTSPGSRSTPLTYALVAHPGIATTPVLDERSAAFFALGLAKRTGLPAVLVCTSGSAAAHYLPALIEAKESGVPLLVFTADRPPELRDCGSGQTIDQQKLFGTFVTFYHELAVPEPSRERLAYLRQTLRHAFARALAGGPVHLNAPFRDPLPPIEDDTARGLIRDVAQWEAFFAQPALAALPAAPAQLALPPRNPASECLLSPEFAAAAGVVICGAGGLVPAEAWALAERLGWPLLADALSPLRLQAPAPARVIAAYDAILRDASAARALRPEAVLIFGDLPTSKVLRAWLAAADAPTLHFNREGINHDALHGRTRHLAGGDLCQTRWTLPAGGERDATWSARWYAAEAAAQRVLAEAGNEPDFEGNLTRAVAETLRTGQTLFVASSMPVRDLEYLAPPRSDGPRVFASRGANGIDGTLSTALGVAHEGEPTVLLTGDLALLHDTNGFLLAPRLRGSLTVVVINNAGGGIFGHLPIVRFDPPFEEYWATPQRVDFARLCAAYSVDHYTATTAAGLRELLRAHVGEPGLRMIEVRTDRTRDVTTRQRVFAAAARAAGEALGA